MKYEKIIDLLHEVERSEVEEFELEKETFRIRIKKAARNSQKAEVDLKPVASKEKKDVKDEEHTEVSIQEGTIIRSPLVGIFHVCGEQEGEKAVSLGSRVEMGQILGAIEAMKLMNDVVSVCSGTISEILVKDKELVEYGQPLFVIEE